MVSALSTMNVQLASPNVHRCRGLQSQGQHTEDKCPDDLRSTHIHPREIFCTDVQMSLQCRMCRGAMRFVLGINIRHKTRRGFEKLSFCLLPHQSSTEECPQVVARGFHINRAPEHSRVEVGTRKRR